MKLCNKFIIFLGLVSKDEDIIQFYRRGVWNFGDQKTLYSTRWARRFDAIFAWKLQFVQVQKAITKTIPLISEADDRDEDKKLQFYCYWFFIGKF